jgi:hypothetical protein
MENNELFVSPFVSEREKRKAARKFKKSFGGPKTKEEVLDFLVKKQVGDYRILRDKLSGEELLSGLNGGIRFTFFKMPLYERFFEICKNNEGMYQLDVSSTKIVPFPGGFDTHTYHLYTQK